MKAKSTAQKFGAQIGIPNKLLDKLMHEILDENKGGMDARKLLDEVERRYKIYSALNMHFV